MSMPADSGPRTGGALAVRGEELISIPARETYSM
jgi:hypothetical protein